MLVEQCVLMYMLFQKRPERALIGACALIRPNTVEISCRSKRPKVHVRTYVGSYKKVYSYFKVFATSIRKFDCSIRCSGVFASRCTAASYWVSRVGR